MENRRKRPTSKRAVASLAEDLIIDILLCLPVKSIARFRCVCTSWYNLLTRDIKFTTMKLDHDARKGNFKLLLTTREHNKNKKEVYSVQLRSVISNKAVKMRYPFENHFAQNIHILGCCNGLVCARHKDYNSNSTTYIWNPCTKECKVIPSLSTVFQTYLHLVTDEYISYGFGYDSKTCDYKFVTIFSEQNVDVSGAVIYYLGSDSWNTYNSCIPYKIRGGEPGVFVSGALHWLASTGKNYQPQVILSFGVGDEIFKEIPQPEHMDYFKSIFVDVLRGCLCLLCSVSKVGFEIWEMKEYGVRESWSKLFKADQQLMMTLGINIPFYRHLRNTVSLQNGETLLHIRCNKKRPIVVKICLEEKERHQNSRKYRYKKYMVQMVAYMETLVSINSNTHVRDVQEQEDLSLVTTIFL